MLDVDGVWELYQSVLSAHGYAALPSGYLWRTPQTTIREVGGVIDGEVGQLDVIARLVQLQDFPAATARDETGVVRGLFTILRTRTDVSPVSNTRFQRLEAVEFNPAAEAVW